MSQIGMVAVYIKLCTSAKINHGCQILSDWAIDHEQLLENIQETAEKDDKDNKVDLFLRNFEN